MTEAVFKEIAERTNGDVYIGVVGPVRVGKSTFVKKVMESVVIPNIVDDTERMRAQDELPQSSPGPVIMTAEPKFVPAQATRISVGDDALSFQIRLADCVGYVIEGTKGYEDENGPKFVHTPWHTEAIPFQEAAKIGTDKVIRDHANIGVVITTDGTVNGINRNAAQKAEEEIVAQLKEIGKPFVIVLNCQMPAREETIHLRNELLEKYEVPVIPISIDQMRPQDIQFILQEALFEFPIRTIEVEKPDWLDVLEPTHELNAALVDSMESILQSVTKIRDVQLASDAFKDLDFISNSEVVHVDAGVGTAIIRVSIKGELYKAVCNEWLDEPIESKKDWLLYIKESAEAKEAQKRFREAINDARKDGYGVTLPMMQEFEPTAPELIKQNNFYGVRMKASAPSFHIIRIDMESEFAPLIGSEFHSQQLLKDLKHAYLHDRDALWQTQLFGTPLHEVLKEGIRYKMSAVPNSSKKRMRQTIERMVNEGERGLVTFIL
ncbi:MAG: stage IV sporulation protein A [Lysinibacillus sp.]